MGLRSVMLAALFAFGASAGAAQHPLSQVREIDDTLMVIAIADDIRNRCDGIDARMIRAFSLLNRLKRRARDLGFSNEEIDAYVSSDDERRRMRAKSVAFLSSRGVDADDTAALCRFGRAQIEQGTAIGRLLR